MPPILCYIFKAPLLFNVALSNITAIWLQLVNNQIMQWLILWIANHAVRVQRHGINQVTDPDHPIHYFASCDQQTWIGIYYNSKSPWDYSQRKLGKNRNLQCLSVCDKWLGVTEETHSLQKQGKEAHTGNLSLFWGPVLLLVAESIMPIRPQEVPGLAVTPAVSSSQLSCLSGYTTQIICLCATMATDIAS